ncbi:MAG: hypothetical protein E6K77_03710 [Candidatus Eisenbacteria bacterium]|uniref:Peptidylprolyl isomerase n=1 Tax=Eiseniibacteriota bacterium TaxID=2212470 RepID=A0A538TLQ0_UNCEI|nr:MAG: hypothetical protein E6K77_03710 [Candidatus Eisenbacteria bacterium]
MNRAPLRYSIALVAVLVLAGACSQDTSRLTPEQEARFQEEGVLRRADNIVFHYTTRVLIHGGSGRSTEIWSFEPPTDAEHPLGNPAISGLDEHSCL